MATKSKSKAAAALLAALALALLAAGLLAGLGGVYDDARRTGETYYDYPSFVETVQIYLLPMYWQARCAWEEDASLDPSAVLLDDENARWYAVAQRRDEARGAEEAPADGDGAFRYAGLALWDPDAAALIDEFNGSIRTYADVFQRRWRNLRYAVVDGLTGDVYAPRDDLRAFLGSEAAGAFASGDWAYVLRLSFDAGGKLVEAEDWRYAASGSAVYSSAPSDVWYDFGVDWTRVNGYLPDGLFNWYDFAPPRTVTFLLAIPRVLAANDDIAEYSGQAIQLYFYRHAPTTALFAMLLAGVLALWAGRRRGSGLGWAHLGRAYLELDAAAGLAAAQLGTSLLLYACWHLCHGDLTNSLVYNFSVDDYAAASVMAHLLAFLLAFAVLGALFLAVLAARQSLVRYGWRRCLSERLLTVLLARWAWGRLRGAWRRIGDRVVQLWHALTRVDLRDSADRTLARLLAVNFAVVAFICCFWIFGIAGTAVYTVALFFLLRGRLRQEQRHYAALLAAARRMAEGDLATPAAGEMGMFDPLRDALNEVRAGFEQAVAEEVRSRNMKTELITNVSHDLKTPLTAIITYVDLLKDPGLPEAERIKYVETLDKKSQRLKRLIEDLFEVSKAASGNVAMHYSTVDLTALLKQVQYELADQAQASGIDFRWQLPDRRVPLVLDGQKTCRIFENLIVNIVKYGMPGTRAYITLTPRADGAEIVFKNVSAAELDFDPAQITERFVRGDRSRNTEGSGLGLAIAKSFAELQGGTFAVAADGDLFKAVVTLPDTNTATQE